METLRWKRLRPQAEAPRRATPGAAGLDLCACLDAPLTLAPGQLALAPTGVAVEIPEGMVGLLFGRSRRQARGLPFQRGGRHRRRLPRGDLRGPVQRGKRAV